jgi:hypothetical protein
MMNDCEFSTPMVADPACSTEVTVTTLQPEVLSSPVVEQLPVTGSFTGPLLALAAVIFVFGLCLHQISVMWQEDEDNDV